MHLYGRLGHPNMLARYMLAAITLGHQAPANDREQPMNHRPATTRHLAVVPALARILCGQRCDKHPAYEADYCPGCGTARVIGGAR